MSKITLKVEIDFESWMDEDTQPKTLKEWSDFFMDYLIEYPKSIIGAEEEGVQKIIALNSYSIIAQDFEIDENK